MVIPLKVFNIWQSIEACRWARGSRMESSRRRLGSFDGSQWSFTMQYVPRGELIPIMPGRFGETVENRVIHSLRGNRSQSVYRYFLAELSQHTITPDWKIILWEGNPSSKELFDYFADILYDVAHYLADIDMQEARVTRLQIFILKTPGCCIHRET